MPEYTKDLTQHLRVGKKQNSLQTTTRSDSKESCSLGNDILYPIALYTSLKMTEFFGITAIANKLEEFCHSPLFGIKPSHNHGSGVKMKIP